jgi:hypothetical protein
LLGAATPSVQKSRNGLASRGRAESRRYARSNNYSNGWRIVRTTSF